MGAVDRSFMQIVGRIGLNEIYVFILLACLLHELGSRLLLLPFLLLGRAVEVSSLAIYRLLENQRNVRMRLLQLFDEREESFTYHLRIRIGERVEDEGIHVCIAEDIRIVWLHLAIAAAGDAEELKAGLAHELPYAAHAGTARAA